MLSDEQRVVITGMGVVSCFGDDVEVFLSKLLSGESGVHTITDFQTDDIPTRFGAQVPPIDTSPWIDRKLARRVDPVSSWAMVAAKKALLQAGLLHEAAREHLDLRRCGVIIGSGMGGMRVFAEGIRTMAEKGFRRLSPFFIPMSLSNMTGALLAVDMGFQGPNYSISTACATSNYCFLAAADHIRRGECDLVIAGGTEAPVDRTGVAGFCACRALSERNDAPEKASRPWDRHRDGFVMGEGAGVLVLESLSHAKKRGATILAELLGGATNCDAYHITEPRPDGSGVMSCMEQAIRNAGLEVGAIEYINAHATSTLPGDQCEILAIRHLFKNYLDKIYLNATKSMIGHSLGAAGSLEAIAVIGALQSGWLHPTLNLDEPEEWVADLHCCAKEKKEVHPRVAMSNSFGFGGHNSSMILARAPEV